MGWRDRQMRVVLFEVFVQSILMFGAPLWGVGLLDSHGRIE